jgi:TorA maturation chaperone TorD
MTAPPDVVGLGREDAEVDVALARAVLYEAVSGGLRLPSAAGPAGLVSGRHALEAAATLLDARRPGSEPLAPAVRRLVDRACVEGRDRASDHARIFGHSLGLVSPYETAYGGGESLRQPHELADIAGYYLAFGLAPPAGADERADHVACECEFLGFLARKEAFLLAGGPPPGMPAPEADEQLQTVRRAAARFLRDHLARFGLAFATRLASADADGFYGALGAALSRLLRQDCAALGVPAGPPTLELRPPAPDAVPMACGSCREAELEPAGIDGGAPR